MDLGAGTGRSAAAVAAAYPRAHFTLIDPDEATLTHCNSLPRACTVSLQMREVQDVAHKGRLRTALIKLRRAAEASAVSSSEAQSVAELVSSEPSSSRDSRQERYTVGVWRGAGAAPRCCGSAFWRAFARSPRRPENYKGSKGVPRELLSRRFLRFFSGPRRLVLLSLLAGTVSGYDCVLALQAVRHIVAPAAHYAEKHGLATAAGACVRTVPCWGELLGVCFLQCWPKDPSTSARVTPKSSKGSIRAWCLVAMFFWVTVSPTAIPASTSTAGCWRMLGSSRLTSLGGKTIGSSSALAAPFEVPKASLWRDSLKPAVLRRGPMRHARPHSRDSADSASCRARSRLRLRPAARRAGRKTAPR